MSEKVKTFRNYTLIMLVALFFIILTIALIFFAQGKRVTPEGKIISTGIIKINSHVSDYSAAIDGKQVDLNEDRIDGVTPGKFKLSISKSGYNKWEKEIELEESQVKTINVKLIPEKVNAEILWEGDILKIIDNASSNNIYIVTQKEEANQYNIYKLDLDSGLLGLNSTDELKKITEFEFDQADDLDFVLSYDSKKLLALSEKSQQGLIIDLESKLEVQDLKNVVGFYPDRVEWLKNSDSLLIQDDQLVYDFDLSSNKKSIIYYDPSENPIYTAANAQVLYITKDSKGLYELNSYRNGSSNRIASFEEEDFESNIIAIETGNQSSDGVMIIAEKEAIFYDLDKEIKERIEGGYDFKVANSNGSQYILSQKDNLYSFYILIEDKEVKTFLKELNLESDNTEVKFTEMSDYIIASGKNTLYLMDKDSDNLVTLISDVNLNQEYFCIDKDLKNIYYLVNDKPEDSQLTDLLEEGLDTLKIPTKQLLYTANIE